MIFQPILKNISEEDQDHESYNEIKMDVLSEEKPEINIDEQEASSIIQESLEENSSPSILDLISRDKDDIEESIVKENESNPDLFTDDNIHELNSEREEEVISSEDDHIETDQDLLEIPSFLRRQSK